MGSISFRNIAILGCGYVGKALGVALVDRGYRVIGTTTTPERLVEIEAAGIVPRLLQTGDSAAVADLVAEMDVVYLAVAARGREASYRDVYLRSARHLVEALRGSRVTRLVYTSSTAVYAQDDGSWVEELSTAKPTSENGRMLLEAEHVLLAAPSPVQVSVVRLGGIYGPGRELHTFAGRFSGQKRGDGGIFLNLIHLEDIVGALVRLLDVRHRGVLNLVADEPTTRREVFDLLLAARTLPPVHWIDDPAQGKGKRVSNRRIRELLRMELRHPRCVTEEPT